MREKAVSELPESGWARLGVRPPSSRLPGVASGSPVPCGGTWSGPHRSPGSTAMEASEYTQVT